MEVFPQLETKRLVLREMRPEDAEAIFHIFGDEEVMRYRDVQALTRLEEAHNSLSGCALAANWERKYIGELRSRKRIISWEFVGTPGI